MAKVRITEGSNIVIEVYRNVNDATPLEKFESAVEYRSHTRVESKDRSGTVVVIGKLDVPAPDGPQLEAGTGATAQPPAGP